MQFDNFMAGVKGVASGIWLSEMSQKYGKCLVPPDGTFPLFFSLTEASLKISVMFPFVGQYYSVHASYINKPRLWASDLGVGSHLNKRAQDNCRTQDLKELHNLRHSSLWNIFKSIFGVLKRQLTVLTQIQTYSCEPPNSLNNVCFVL